MNIEYTIQIWKEKEQFVAHAMPLDVMSSGPTPEKARHALAEAVDLFLITAAEVGTLTDLLEEAGYEKEQKLWTSPPWISVERHFATFGN